MVAAESSRTKGKSCFARKNSIVENRLNGNDAVVMVVTIMMVIMMVIVMVTVITVIMVIIWRKC